MMAFTPTASFNKSFEKRTGPNIKMQKSGAKSTIYAKANARF